MTKIEQIVKIVENSHPGKRVGPYIGNKYRLAGTTPTIINIAQIHDTNEIVQAVIILVNETFLVIFKLMKYVTAGNKPSIQVVPQAVPMKQETPLPPLNEAKIGKQCPKKHPKTVNQ